MGNVYSLSRWLGVKAKELRQRLPAAEDCPSIDEASAALAAVEYDAVRRYRSELREAAATVKAEYAEERQEMVAHQRRVRANLLAEQRRRQEAAAVEREPTAFGAALRGSGIEFGANMRGSPSKTPKRGRRCRKCRSDGAGEHGRAPIGAAPGTQTKGGCSIGGTQTVHASAARGRRTSMTVCGALADRSLPTERRWHWRSKAQSGDRLTGDQRGSHPAHKFVAWQILAHC